MRSPLDSPYDNGAALAQAGFYILCGIAVLSAVVLVLLLELW